MSATNEDEGTQTLMIYAPEKTHVASLTIGRPGGVPPDFFVEIKGTPQFISEIVIAAGRAFEMEKLS